MEAALLAGENSACAAAVGSGPLTPAHARVPGCHLILCFRNISSDSRPLRNEIFEGLFDDLIGAFQHIKYMENQETS